MAVALSNREKEVAELLAWGAAKKEIADILSQEPLMDAKVKAFLIDYKSIHYEK